LTSPNSEHVEQRELIKWFRRTFPSVLIFAIPNGGMRNKITAAKLKAEGVVPGIPDLFVPEWRLWVEMKRKKGGVVSQDQREVISSLEALGYPIIIGRGAENAKEQIARFYENLMQLKLPL